MEQKRLWFPGELAGGFDGVIGDSIGGVVAFRKRATNNLIIMTKHPCSSTLKWWVGLRWIETITATVHQIIVNIETPVDGTIWRFFPRCHLPLKAV